MSAWFGSSLGDPWMLTLLALLPLAWWTRRLGLAPSLRMSSIASARPSDESSPTVRLRLRALPSTIHALALAALCVALARPIEHVPGTRTAQGIDILLCLDVSSSMQERDPGGTVTRFDAARRALEDFVSRRPGDRIGLLSFAAHADLVAPPTLDHEGLRTLLTELRTVEPDGPEDMTGIGNAIARAAEVASTSTVESRIAILFTDGRETLATPDRPEEISPLESVALCREFGVRLYAITTADDDTLRRVAPMTDGRSFRVDDGAALAEALTEIDELERSPIVTTDEHVEERFAAWALLGLVLGALSLVLRAGPLGVTP
ncbi:MAG: VWA domain-containing protein [Planctomycetes bacterium]|nr:VWA domain-containing protein [Planctomycetota bacterium]